MQIRRCWPDPMPEGRTGYVVDDCPRLLNSDYSYRGLVALDDDVISLDWDTAVGREDLIGFAKRCRSDPDRLRVVPQIMDVGWRKGWLSPRWNCMVYEAGERQLRHIRTGEPETDLFGFGMVYLPRGLLREFEDTWAAKLDAGTHRFDDLGFAGWHYRQRGKAVVDWDVTAVHLHYSMLEVPL